MTSSLGGMLERMYNAGYTSILLVKRRNMHAATPDSNNLYLASNHVSYSFLEDITFFPGEKKGWIFFFVNLDAMPSKMTAFNTSIKVLYVERGHLDDHPKDGDQEVHRRILCIQQPWWASSTPVVQAFAHVVCQMESRL